MVKSKLVETSVDVVAAAWMLLEPNNALLELSAALRAFWMFRAVVAGVSLKLKVMSAVFKLPSEMLNVPRSTASPLVVRRRWTSLPATSVVMPGTFLPAMPLLKMTVKGPPSLPMTETLPASEGRPGVAPIDCRLSCTCFAVGEAAGT